MKISVHGKTTVKTFKAQIHEHFGVHIKVHRGFSMGHYAEDHETVASIRSEGAQEVTGEIELHGNMKVSTAEETIKTAMGFAVQILNSSGANADNDATLRSLAPAASTTPQPTYRPAPVVASTYTPPPAAHPVTPAHSPATAEPPTESKSRFVASLLAIFLGLFGAHKFYLGYRLVGVLYLAGFLTLGVMTDRATQSTREGVDQSSTDTRSAPDSEADSQSTDQSAPSSDPWAMAGAVLMLFTWIEGLVYLTKSRDGFHRTYVVQKRYFL